VRELGLNSPEMLQLRKEGIWEADSIGGEQGMISDAGVGRKKASLTRGPAVSASGRERKAARSHELGQRWLAGLGPSGNAGKGENGSRAG
jgi:hypothetical protein